MKTLDKMIRLSQQMIDVLESMVTPYQRRDRLLNILNLGAGVQSSTVFLMSCLGELPKFDVVIFADTGWEPAAVYRQLEYLEAIGAEHGIPVVRVSVGNVRNDAMTAQRKGQKVNGHRWGSMPMFTLSPDGQKGMIRRQCTYEYKIRPISRYIKTEVLGLKVRDRWPKEHVVRQWYGISADEARRRKLPSSAADTPVYWKSHVYPLCGAEWFGTRPIYRDIDTSRLSRQGCQEWLAGHGFPEAPRSACIGCPFHSGTEWEQIRQNLIEWSDAVAFDESIRKCDGMYSEVFLHASRVPLRNADLGTGGAFTCDEGVCAT